MTHEQLVTAMRAQGGVADSQAERGLEVSLESLGERLSGGAARQLAEQLPDRDASALRRRADGAPQAGGTVDVAARIAERAGISTADGAALLQATMRAIAEAVDQQRLDRVRAQLPADLSRLLQRTEPGDTSQVRTGAWS
jgi:uncharacterized protein (DUF2267 family)